MSQLQYYLALVAGGLCAAALALSFATPLETALLLKAFLALGIRLADSLLRCRWASGPMAPSPCWAPSPCSPPWHVRRRRRFSGWR